MGIGGIADTKRKKVFSTYYIVAKYFKINSLLITLVN